MKILIEKYPNSFNMKEVRKNLRHRLKDQFQNLMGTSGQLKGHFDMK